ncbi:hypothetical protein EST38_g1627 [Candolleomyces aberdarensis]|uniref:DUF6533 domain-containing protein n=1 Tax=Candolleomyces aberdarensis TaxID=2316362 RepID=A0A4Q2DY54_9AGAR|nr:hypothetical protein EST38_g1627 [Candolleomyces aberdarensis]
MSEAAASSAWKVHLAWSTTVVVYDHLSTLDLEIELIWKKKWSLIQILFIINRYVPDAAFLYGAVRSAGVHLTD